jgi:hypothetical protein
LAFVVDDNQALVSRAISRDQAGERAGSNAVAHFHVTKVSDYDVVLLKARIAGINREYSSVSTAAGRQNQDDSRHAVHAHRMAEVMANFTFFPQAKIRTGALIRDVIFTDNYGNEHRVRAVRFKTFGPP